MGYRSDLISAVVFCDHAHKLTSLVKWKLYCANENLDDPLESDMGGDALKESISHIKCGKHPGIMLRGEDWKWYDGYRSVTAWNLFLDWMYAECNAATVMLRIGEDTTDVQEEYRDPPDTELNGFDFWAYFGVTRQVYADVAVDGDINHDDA